MTAFTTHLQIITTNNYNSFTDLFTLQIIIVQVKFQSVIAIMVHRLVASPNNGYPSAYMLTSLLVGDCLTVEWVMDDSYR